MSALRVHRRKLHYWLSACAVVGVAIVGGCGSSGGGTSTPLPTPITPTPTPTRAAVNVMNDPAAPMGFSFQSPVTVKSATVVTWTNNSAAPHNIVWDAQSPASSPAPGANIGIFSGGATSSPWTAPTVTGNTTYNYHCGIHGPTMAGQVIVTP